MVNADCIERNSCCLATLVFHDSVNFASNLKPTMCYHAEGIKTLIWLNWVVSKRSSKITWNCGKTKPVVRLRTHATDSTGLGDRQRYTPSLVPASHILMDLFAASEEYRAKTEQPNVGVGVWVRDILLFLQIFPILIGYWLEKAVCHLHNMQFSLHGAILMYEWPVAIWLGHYMESLLPVLENCKHFSQKGLFDYGHRPHIINSLFLLISEHIVSKTTIIAIIMIYFVAMLSTESFKSPS